MEIAIWAFIVFVLVALFKTLKYEKTDFVYNEKQLLKRYMEIKQLPQEYRVMQIKEWELSVVSALSKKNTTSLSKVVQLHSNK
jgi:hypothetical protein